jgi:SAM-dependent methyltransferase
MTELTGLVEPAVLEAYDFSQCGTIVDVGGGHGGLIASILKKHTNLKGIVYDSPDVVAGAPEHFADAGVADRASAIGGDFFASVPAGGDTYIMKHIIHDWYDDLCTTILRHCHAVMKPGGKLLIVDQVLPGRNEPSVGKFSDLLMMIMPGGMERTADEFRTLVEGAGFKFSRIVPTKSLVSVVEATK